MHTTLRRTTRLAALGLIAASLPVLAGIGSGAGAAGAAPATDQATDQAHAHDHAEEGVDYLVPPANARIAHRPAAASGDAGNQIDLLIAFTPEAAALAGGTANVPAVAAQVISDSNAIFANSQVPLSVRLVGSVVTAQGEVSGDLDANLRALTTKGDGAYDEIHTLREQYHADQVSLVAAGDHSSCGIGWLGGNDTYAFTASEYQCLGQYTLTHELGHNLDARHDRYPGVTNDGKIPDAAGLVNLGTTTATRWRTVMAYNNACAAQGYNCTRIPYFSNPAVAYNGVPTGTATANNARVITAFSPTMANFRQEQIYPGALSYSGSARYKGKLKIKSTAWAPANVGVGFQWFLDGQPISGATGATFKPGKKHIGHSLTVLATGSAPYYPTVNASSAPIAVKKAKFKTKKPALQGKHRVGSVLKVKLKKYKPKKKVKVRFQWYRDGKKIKHAKKRTYKVRGKDRKDKVWCVVKLKKKNYETAKIRTKKVKIKR